MKLKLFGLMVAIALLGILARQNRAGASGNCPPPSHYDPATHTCVG
jgi:hypothetical protein